MLDLSKRAYDAFAMAVSNSTTPGNEQPEPVNVFAIILFMVTLLFAGACFILVCLLLNVYYVLHHADIVS